MNSSDLVKACLSEVQQTEARLIYILGADDAGKTTLTKLLANQLILGNKSVAIIDADPGQSNRLPLTLSLNYTAEQFEEFSDLTLIDWNFIPGYDLLKWLERCIDLLKEWVRRAIKETNHCLIDSNGDIRKALKLEEIRAINPDLIIALQRGRELEPILEILNQVLKLPIPAQVKKKSGKQRKQAKNERLKAYFKNCLIQQVECESPRNWEHKIVGLYSQKRFLGLGITRDKKGSKLSIVTPVHIKAERIEFSSVKIELEIWPG